jgi:hypothetical protein
MAESVQASTVESLEKEEAFSLLKDGFNAQVSLSEYVRSYEEVKEILDPHFTDGFVKSFLEENLFEEEDGFIIYGSDFAPYYIPYFSYSENTKFVYDEVSNTYYVYEKFEENNEGPVSHGEFYALITIQKINNVWNISDLSLNEKLNEEIIKLKQKVTEEAQAKKKVVSLNLSTYKSSDKSQKNIQPFLPFGYLILEMEYKFQTYSTYGL